MQIRKGGAWRTITSGKAYINGAWRTLLNGQGFKSNRWRDICNFTGTPTPTPTPSPTMTLSLSATSIFAESFAVPMTTNSVNVTPSGGASPYKYVWSIVTTDGHSFTITTPASASTGVSITSLPQGASAGCSIHCVCTDNTGLTATSANVTAGFFRDFNDSGGTQ